MSDTPQHLESVNDHPTLKHSDLTPARVVDASASERLELHRATLEAGATSLAAELERWCPSEQLEQLSTADLALWRADAVTSDLAARIAAELEQRRLHALAAYKLSREQLGRSSDPCAGSRILHERFARATDTGREYGPIAERVRHARRGRRGWLVASSDSGRLSLVLWRRVEIPQSNRPDAWRQTLPRRVRTEWVPTSETRLGWSA